ncbi:MAG: ABC transporter ATP-binding protein [Chlamydiae bacterium]|nr:ABC transporter ATP-binding protein [Chlamydiota bacterium]
MKHNFGAISFIWPFIKKQKWIFLSIFLLDALAWPLETVLWPYLLHFIIDIFAKYELNRDLAWQFLQKPVFLALALVIFVEIASRTMGYLLAKGLPRLLEDIRMNMFEHVQYHSPQYFHEKFSGSLANKISDMTTHLQNLLLNLYWPIIPAIMTAVFGSFTLWYVSPWFSFMLLMWTLIHITICLFFGSKSTKYQQKHSEVRSKLIGAIVDSFTNNYAVNLFYSFTYEKQRILASQQEETKANIYAFQYVEQMKIVTSCFFILLGIVGIFGSFIYLWLNGLISTGQAVQVFVTVWGFSGVLWGLGSSLPQTFQSIGIIKQAFSLIEDQKDVLDSPSAIERKIERGEIFLDRVSFSYPNSNKLFENMSIHIRSGEKIGLVGYTGSGKSTFVNLILRLYPVSSGKILIDDCDIAQMTLESLRRQIAVIPQDPILFHRSLLDNIRYSRLDAEDKEILYASKLAHADEFIKAMPEGYNTKVGERGMKLSGGEKQRIAIARAILSKAPILIFDEATSQLDTLTERYIQESLEKIMQQKTTIVIAHRLSTLSKMDRLLVFQSGRIVEEGSHNELLAKDGLYAKMWGMQVNGFLPL